MRFSGLNIPPRARGGRGAPPWPREFLKKKEFCFKRIDKEKQIFLCFEEGKRKNGFLKIENGTILLQIDTEKLIQENGFLKIIYEIKNQETKIDKIEFAFYYEVI